MTFENVIMALTFISSAVALYFATRKQSHDEDKCDADTIASLFQTVRELEADNKQIKDDAEADRVKLEEKFRCENDKIKKELADYKRTTTQQLAEMASEIVRYRNWAARLVKQLEQAGIVPERFE